MICILYYFYIWLIWIITVYFVKSWTICVVLPSVWFCFLLASFLWYIEKKLHWWLSFTRFCALWVDKSDMLMVFIIHFYRARQAFQHFVSTMKQETGNQITKRIVKNAVFLIYGVLKLKINNTPFSMLCRMSLV